MSQENKISEVKLQNTENISADNSNSQVDNPSDVIDLKGLLLHYAHHWYWFLISLIVCGGMGWFYMKKKSPVYQSNASIMLNQNSDEYTNLSGITAIASQFGFGGSRGGSSANVYDEITRLSSQRILSDVVAACHLNVVAWSNQGFFKPKTFYYRNEPFSIQAPQSVLDSMSTASEFLIDAKTDGSAHIEIRQLDETVLEADVKKFPFTARTPAATFVIDKTKYYKSGKELEFHAFATNTPLTILNMRSNFAVKEVDKKGNAIYIGYSSTCPDRAEGIIDTLISLYNDERYQSRIKRRREALAFVEERLIRLYSELEQSETQIEDFKRDNKIVDAQAEAEFIFTRKGAIEGAATQTRTELEIYTMVRDMLSSSKTRYSLLPFASAGDEAGSGNALAMAVGSYNELILKRMELQSGLKGQSGALDRLTDQIDALRENILATIGREIQAKKIALAAVETQGNISDNRITEIPYMEKRLTQMYRDREVKNAIYAFLLQKREDAEIAIQQVDPISEIIDPAYTDPKPISPVGMLVYAVAGFMGILLPLIFVKLWCKPREEKPMAE